MSIFGSITAYVKFSTENTGLHSFGFYDERSFRIFGHFKISLTLQSDNTFVANKGRWIDKVTISIEPDLRAVT